MPFWRKDTEEEAQLKLEAKQREADQKESIRSLEAGGLPLQATRRLTEQAKLGSAFFNSSLTTNEYLLAREAGYQPIGQVMGSAFMNMGFNNLNWKDTGEIWNLTQAHKQARALAVDRLKLEAGLLGADGVIGVRVKRSDSSWAGGLAEFTAIGTAIKVKNRHMISAVKNLPFTSSLSGQEFWQLFEGGILPCALVMGNCSYFVFGNQQVQRATSGFWSSMQNQELTQYNDGLQTARHLALVRLREQIADEEADGAVDMDIHYKIEPHHIERNDVHYSCLLIDFVALGTAIIDRTSHSAQAPRIQHEPMFIIDLNKGRSKNLEYAVEEG